jgi:hypothetical protein
MAKLQFIFGGDYLFRAASIGILVSIAVSIYDIKNVQKPNVRRIFIVNLLTLMVAYCGMMLKVSHIMETQFEKDLVLDVLAYPAIIGNLLYTFANAETLINQNRMIQVRFIKHALLPWCVFIFSLILYAVYSAALSRMVAVN